MARKALSVKNEKKNCLVQKNYQKRSALKSSIYDKNISIKERILLVHKLHKMKKNASKVRVRNLCFITKRPRGVSRKLGISRHQIRDLIGKLMIPGLTKSSW